VILCVRQDAVTANCVATSPDGEGPYYKPSAPLRAPNADRQITVCENSPANFRLFINGTIRFQTQPGSCGAAPVKALIDIWQADGEGNYSSLAPGNPDFTCRTRFYTDTNGFYAIATKFPGRYICKECDRKDFRPSHVHFKITPVDEDLQPVGPMLTTQLYFANDWYLGPRDACLPCGSNQVSQTLHLQQYTDIKTYEGTWDIILSNAMLPRQQFYTYAEKTLNWNKS